MIWKKMTIDTTVEVVDLISDFLSELGVEGVMIEDNVPLTEQELKEMYVDVPLMMGEDDGSARVSCFLDDTFSAERIEDIRVKTLAELDRLEEFLPVGKKTIVVADTEDDSVWTENWKKNYRPFRLNENIVICPTWETYDDIHEDDIVVKIESVMAFGTGTHETTKLCIGQLKKYIQPGQSVFDVGCGSGILSIIAVYLGAGYVHGLDIDPQAIASSKENAEANGFDEERIDFSTGNLLAGNVIGAGEEEKEKIVRASIGSGVAAKSAAELVDLSLGGYDPIPQRKYNVVVANILADVIIPLSGVIRPYLEEDGIFVTSGIIDTKEEEVKEAMLKNGFEIIDVLHMGEWVSIVAK